MKHQGGNRSINDFFKPFTVPKNRIPLNDRIEEDIIVASSPRPDSIPAKGDGSPQNGSFNVDPHTRATQKRRHDLKSAEEGSLSSYTNTPTPTNNAPHRPRRHSPQASEGPTCDESNSPAATPRPGRKPRAIRRYDGANDETSSLSPVPSSAFSPSLPTRTNPNLPPKPRDPSDPATMAPPSQQPAKQSSPKPTQDLKPASASFGSFSTLSSVPVSSQSSSRRVVKNGVKGVTNSDSGSADSSGDELADIDFMFRNKRRKVTPSPPPPMKRDATPKTTDHHDAGTRNMRLSHVRRDTQRPPAPPKPTYKYSLANMVKQNAKNHATSEVIAQAEASVQQAGKWREEEAAKVNENDGLSMAVAMADDSDAGERMRNAMARTEALREDEVFYFFNSTEPISPRSAFPLDALPEQGWTSILDDEETREDNILSGFVAEMSASEPLPQLVVDWMASELAYESREELCEAYVEIIRACTVSHGFETALLSALDGFYDTCPLTGYNSPSEKKRRRLARLLPNGVRYMVQAVRHSVEGRDQESTADTLFAFALLNVDENVKNDIDLQLVLHSNMDALLEAVSGSVLSAVYTAVREKVFSCMRITDLVRLRLINALPATSTRLYEMRRTLALRCFGSDLVALPETAVSAAVFTNLLDHIRDAHEWAISDVTDYTILHALTDVLTTAVPAGFTPSHPLLALPTPTSPAYAESDDKPSLFGASKSPESDQSNDEKDFNTRLDALVSQLRSVSSRIKDAGTSHLKRTEAKAAMERLIVMLEANVRTKVKRRRGVFDEGPQGGLMDMFLGGVERDI